MSEIKSSRLLFWQRFSLAGLVCLAGLSLRILGYPIGLPFIVVKYGASLLWGAMVFWLIAAILRGVSTPALSAVSFIVSVGSELFRLFHTPWLDEFRLTLAGALILGRLFSGWNILAYALGIGLAAVVDDRLLRRSAL